MWLGKGKGERGKRGEGGVVFTGWLPYPDRLVDQPHSWLVRNSSVTRQAGHLKLAYTPT